jgi:REP element-mobilizing transposase RayT
MMENSFHSASFSQVSSIKSESEPILHAETHVTNKYARKRRYKGYHFWARGYFVSTAGYDEQVVRRYIRNQVMTSTKGGGLKRCA